MIFSIVLVLGVVLSALAAVGGVYTVYATYARELPDAGEVQRLSESAFETTRIYDRTGQHLLYEIIAPDGGRRTIISLQQMPESLRNATIAMEDKTFYSNPAGINIEGLGRALVAMAKGEDSGGGSSIPQQLIKNVMFDPEERMERNFTRKIKELVLTYELSRRYPGDEGRDKILEWYLNTVFYGHFAYGVEAAAQTYFAKPASQLTLAESAMLVPLGNAPAYNPWDNPIEAKRRQELVLDTMAAQGYITPEEALAAKKEIIITTRSGFALEAPHYVLYVRSLLEKRFGIDRVYGGGLQVISAIDLEKQAQTEQIARERIAEAVEKYNVHNASVVVIDVKTGEILAMVGSLDYNNKEIDGEVNMTISPRQPGSSFKVFTYATAFEQGYTAATMMLDVRTAFPDPPRPMPYSPENSDRTYHGPVLLREAFATSLNVPAVQMINNVGVQNVINTAHAMGINDLNDSFYGLSLTLGTGPVKLLDMTYAFSVFANTGVMVGAPVTASDVREGYRKLDPVAILKVTDAKGNVLYEYEQPQHQTVIAPQVAYLVNNILSDNSARASFFGYNSPLYISDRQAAVKTGTTDGYHDAWTIGYTPQYAVGVWTGNTDYAAMTKGTGSQVAAPLWRNVMLYLHEGLPAEPFPVPDGLEYKTIDATSGKLPTQYSSRTKREVFIAGTAPTTFDDINAAVRICRLSEKLATEYCPPDEVDEKVYMMLAPEADDYLRSREIEQPPDEFCDVHGPDGLLEVVISSPATGKVAGGVITITGSVLLGDLQNWYLEAGEGEDPSSWWRVGGDHAERVERDVLDTWDTTGLNGPYSLRLTAVSTSGIIKQYTSHITLDQSGPSILLRMPYDGQTFTLGVDEWVDVQVTASDNIGIDKVEVFVNGASIGYTTVSPYAMRWVLTSPWGTRVSPGSYSIYAVAYDTAGNSTSTGTVTVRVVRE